MEDLENHRSIERGEWRKKEGYLEKQGEEVGEREGYKTKINA